jgi:bacillithiol biosynthesis cysteine-adding enzyme BshC
VRGPFSSAYLAGEATARQFLPLDFRDAADRDGRARVAADRARAIDPALAAELRAQQARLPGSPARAANLDALAAGRAAVVATGQQVGLFLGPLYGFYKAASAIAVARALEAESGVRCVPLFWLQTEDHDFAEIASTTIADHDGGLERLCLGGERPGDPRVSIAHRCLGDEVTGLLESAAALLGSAPAARDTIALLRAHYRPGEPLAAAFAGLMAELFADEGLLFLDPRRAPVARLAAPIYSHALKTAAAIETCLAERHEALARAGFEDQIPLRPGCALVFHHRESPSGPRFRLQREPPVRDWRLAGAEGTISDAEVAALLERDPLRFSTSALLRPIVQDSILPVAAYVGGPAEVSYFAQLAPLYEHFRLPPPLVVPRARFRVLDARTRRLLEQLRLAPDDLARPRDELVARVAQHLDSGDAGPAALARLTDEVQAAVGEITQAVAASDPRDKNLVRAAERTRASVESALARLARRHARKLAERDRVALERLARLQNALAPGGVPQERAYAWPSLAGRVGPRALKQLVMDRLAAVGPFATALQELEA